MKLIIKNRYKHKQQEAVNLVNKLVSTYKLPLLIKAKKPSTEREKSPWLSVREFEQQAKDLVEDLLFNLFIEIRRKWLKQTGEFHKAQDDLFRLNGKIYISPKTGKPLTKKQWNEVVKGLDSAMVRIFKDKPEYLVKRAMLLGKVLQGMDYENRQREKFGNLTLPFTIAKTEPWQNAYTFAEQNAAELIQDIQSTTRKRITQSILTSIKNKETTRQLETRLFDKLADTNRDWRMIAETEISNSVNNGILLSELEDAEEGEPVFMIGVSAGNACKHCVRLVKGNVVVLLSEPGNEYVKVNGKRYATIWPGKDNYGYKANNYRVAIIIHPNCRCSWTRFYPEMATLLKKSKSYPIGTVREWKGKKYVKTSTGWKPQKSVNKKEFHDFMQAQRQEMEKYRHPKSGEDLGEASYFDWIKENSKEFRERWVESHGMAEVKQHLVKSTDLLLQQLVVYKLGVKL